MSDYVYEWQSELTDDEQRAMTELGVDPGYNDFSSLCVLDAYRMGRRDERGDR